MSANAEIKHSVALFAVAVGGAALLVTAVMVYVAIDSGKQGWFGCAAVPGLLGLFQIRRGLKLRNKAVAEGADMTEFKHGPLHRSDEPHRDAKAVVPRSQEQAGRGVKQVTCKVCPSLTGADAPSE